MRSLCQPLRSDGRRRPFAGRAGAGLRRLLVEESGFSLTELLVGSAIGAVLMVGVTSAIFTVNGLWLRADGQNRIAAAFALAAVTLDRDAAMATASAPARSQTSAVGCDTTIDLGFLEGGASVRLRTVASAAPEDGPLWLQRVSGAATRTIARNVAACTWLVESDAGGDPTLRLDLTITGPGGESASQTLRARPRLW